MRILTVARKPLDGTVAKTALKHGTGGLHIDKARIGASGGTARSGQAEYPKNPDGTEDRSHSWARTGHGIVETGGGRWPANVILQHLDGCAQAGFREVAKGEAGVHAVGEGGQFGTAIYGASKGRVTQTRRRVCNETVAVWRCEPGCPVSALDEQSGVLTSGGASEGVRVRTGNVLGYFAPVIEQGRSASSGGASRFFKQIGGADTECNQRPAK